MKGYKLTAPFTLSEQELSENANGLAVSKVRLTKSLVTLADVLRFRGDIECKNIVLGSSGIGVISDAEANLFDLEKGTRVYIQSERPLSTVKKNGALPQVAVAGENFDGFLCDFVSVDADNLFELPKSVSDHDALYIDHIARAITVIDSLDIQKGEYVAILGANNFGIILAELLIYYQAVPVLITDDKECEQIARNSGIYYVLSDEDSWQKDLITLTSGRLAEKVVYLSDSNITVSKAFTLSAFNASVAFTGTNNKTNPVSFNQAIKKQLTITCVNNGYGNTTTAINLLANKAINLSFLKTQPSTYLTVETSLKELSDQFEETGFITETIVDLV